MSRSRKQLAKGWVKNNGSVHRLVEKIHSEVGVATKWALGACRWSHSTSASSWADDTLSSRRCSRRDNSSHVANISYIRWNSPSICSARHRRQQRLQMDWRHIPAMNFWPRARSPETKECQSRSSRRRTTPPNVSRAPNGHEWNRGSTFLLN